MKNKNEIIFVCKNCGNEFGKWAGQCSACKEWNTLKEAPNYKSTTSKQISKNKFQNKSEIKKLSEMKVNEKRNDNVFNSNIGEFDRVLGKGIVRGSVVLFAGEPGIGKSTLLTQLVGKVGGLYVAGEESAEQINLRVKRLGVKAVGFDVLETNSIEEIVQTIERTQNVYKIAVVDSIQTMVVGETLTGTGSLGSFSVNQIHESTFDWWSWLRN
jgi:DNA repair protein RadA/Sms